MCFRFECVIKRNEKQVKARVWPYLDLLCHWILKFACSKYFIYAARLLGRMDLIQSHTISDNFYMSSTAVKASATEIEATHQLTDGPRVSIDHIQVNESKPNYELSQHTEIVLIGIIEWISVRPPKCVPTKKKFDTDNELLSWRKSRYVFRNKKTRVQAVRFTCSVRGLLLIWAHTKTTPNWIKSNASNTMPRRNGVTLSSAANDNDANFLRKHFPPSESKRVCV